MQPFAHHAVTAFGALVLFSAAASADAPADCWLTRCQRDSWPVKGCGQYGAAETERKPCAGGHVYTCCRPTDKTAAAAGSWSSDGCRAFDTTDGVRSPCADGYQHVCCTDRTPEDDDDDDDDDHDDDDDDDDDHDDDDHDDDDHKDDDDHDDDDHKDDDDYNGRVRTGRMTYFHLALTACGKTYTDRDMVGALGPYYFTHHGNPNDDPLCGKKVKIVDAHSSKSVVVRIVDKCGGCSKYDVDVSPAAFKKIKPLRAGVVRVKWAFVS